MNEGTTFQAAAAFGTSIRFAFPVALGIREGTTSRGIAAGREKTMSKIKGSKNNDDLIGGLKEETDGFDGTVRIVNHYAGSSIALVHHSLQLI